MFRQAITSRVFPFLRAVAIGACCPLAAAQAQDDSGVSAQDTGTIDEIVVTVDRAGKPVDVDAIRLREAMLKVIREFEFEQYKQEEESWRLRLRSAMNHKTSRLVWGYDAQTEAARFRYNQANYLPIDRVGPATLISFRF
jgi:hypothetical protein